MPFVHSHLPRRNPILNAKYKGILCILSAAFFFALMALFVRLAGDLPSIQKSFFRNLVAAVAAAFLLLRDRRPIAMDGKSWFFLILRAAFGTLGVLCNFYAVDHLLLADASMLSKMSPFFAILFSFLLLKERISLFQAGAVLAAFGGCVLIMRPTGLAMELLPAFIGLLGGAAAGLAYTIVRLLSQRGVRGPFIVFFFSAFSCLVTLPFLLFSYHPMTGQQLAYLLLAGAAAAGGQFSVTAAYSFAPARELSVYDYSQVLFSALLGFLCFQQIPDLLSWVGYTVICSAAAAMFLHTRRHAQS
ncbi:DMT family transporter [Pseudoflavonifractor sp. 524-17]|nr:DMT family transporter [Pseudoflavonifractor sp. 524-17]